MAPCHGLVSHSGFIPLFLLRVPNGLWIHGNPYWSVYINTYHLLPQQPPVFGEEMLYNVVEIVYTILFTGTFTLLTVVMVCVCVRSQLRLLSLCSTVRRTGVEIHCSQASPLHPTHSRTKSLVCFCESTEPFLLYVHMIKANVFMSLCFAHHRLSFFFLLL